MMINGLLECDDDWRPVGLASGERRVAVSLGAAMSPTPDAADFHRTSEAIPRRETDRRPNAAEKIVLVENQW